MDSDALTAKLLALDAYVARVLERSEQRGDDRTVLQGVGEGRRNIETLARLGPLGELERRVHLLEQEKEGDDDGDPATEDA